MIPQEGAVDRLMADTGMDRVQAYRHLRDRAQVQRLVAATASQRDLASWRWAHDSADKWVPGRYSYKPPSHVVLAILSSQGRSYVSKPLSLITPYKLDMTSTEAATYEQLIRRQGAKIIGRWRITLKKGLDEG